LKKVQYFSLEIEFSVLGVSGAVFHLPQKCIRQTQNTIPIAPDFYKL